MRTSEGSPTLYGTLTLGCLMTLFKGYAQSARIGLEKKREVRIDWKGK